MEKDINKLYRAIVKSVSKIQTMVKEADGSCCPTCVFGRRFTELVDKCERQVFWLRTLVSKAELKGVPVENNVRWLLRLSASDNLDLLVK